MGELPSTLVCLVFEERFPSCKELERAPQNTAVETVCEFLLSSHLKGQSRVSSSGARTGFRPARSGVVPD